MVLLVIIIMVFLLVSNSVSNQRRMIGNMGLALIMSPIKESNNKKPW
jgi:hypothetical protein